jgi:ABC-2 type transport system permease protein
MFFLSGAFFPLRKLPIWMEVLTRIDPVSYGVDPLRQVVLRETVSPRVIDLLSRHPIGINVLAMAIFGTVFLVTAVWLFSKTDV